MPDHLELYGCRHDILGHYLKAIGLLRVLAKCAAPEHRDSDAEGWWDTDKGCFCLSSPKYPSKERLGKFFASHYRPTPLFSAWNKDPGSSKAESVELGVNADWEIASKLSSQVVSADERKKPANRDKLIAAEAFEVFREIATASVTEAADSISVPFLKSGADHPLFLSKGIAGRAHLWKTHWGYLATFQKYRDEIVRAGNEVAENRGASKRLQELKERAKEAKRSILNLLPFEVTCASMTAGKGTPFFPDAIKTYNTGSGWVTEKYPFNALDYVLAVEGGFAMRGSVGRTLAANSRRFAAFPFVFDAGEELVDDGNEVKGTSSALWFPVWDRPVTFGELSSFICDAQANLPGKEARFSAEFVRALHSQGVDSGFTGWQEFRFKMKISRVPWVTTGAYVQTEFSSSVTLLNRALQPLDESQFLDQFEIVWARGGKADAKSPHPLRAVINAAMETAARETTPHHCLDLLGSVFNACRQMAISEPLRETLPGKRARFFRPLPMGAWNELLRDLNEPEFRIARAVASIQGNVKQRDGMFSSVLPMLGSLLPLKLGLGGWFLPSKGDRSRQAIWTGSDICHDLATVLARRYMDSLSDDRPALMPANDNLGARLSDVLLFLNRELDDHLIARWIEALSLIGWKFADASDGQDRNELDSPAIPPEYAALRALLDLECEWPGKEESTWTRRRSQQPMALLCQRSASALPLAVTEALRWIAIWGVKNPHANKEEKERLAGRDIINLRNFSLSSQEPEFPARLAAAVCIPLHWQDRDALYRAVSLPQSD